MRGPDTSFVVLPVGQRNYCMHFPKFLHRISNVDKHANV